MKPSLHVKGLTAFCLVVACCMSALFVGHYQGASAYTADSLVFGPQEYRREQGRPQTSISRFGVSGADSVFRLNVVNGDPDDNVDFDTRGKARVSSASIFINDIEVRGSKDINKNTRRLSLPVTLIEGENTIKVTLGGNPVSMLTLSIIAEETLPPPDVIAPKVDSVSPPDGFTGADVDLDVTVTFSEQIALDTLTASSFFLSTSEQTINGSISVPPGSNTAIFSPAVPLSYSTRYTVTLTSAIKDLAGNALTPSWVSVFTTEPAPPPPPPDPDTDPPRVSSISPQAGSIHNQNSIPVVVRFNEPIDISTIGDNLLLFADTAQGGGTVIIQEGGSFIAVPNGERIDGSVEAAPDGLGAKFIPTIVSEDGTSRETRLPANATITVVVLTRVKDPAGNSLDQDLSASGLQFFSGNFTTSAFNLTGSTLVGRINPQGARLQAALMSGDEVLVSGGFNELNEVNATAEVYNAREGTFRSVAMIDGRAEHTTTVLNNGQVLVVGGIGENGQVLSSAEIYDPQSGIFSPVGSLHSPRFGHTATLLPDGSVLIAGGFNAAALDTAEIFIPAGGTLPVSNAFVEVIARMGSARAFNSATPLRDGSVLLAGGVSNGEILSTAEVFIPPPFAPQLGQFVSTNSRMSTPRFRHASTILEDGRVLITGGKDSSTRVLKSAEFFTPSSVHLLSSFSPAGDMAEARANHSCTVLPDGSVLLAGGSSNQDLISTTAELYQNSRFTQVSSPLSNSRSSHAAVLMSNGTVLLANGESREISPALKTAETYTPRR